MLKLEKSGSNLLKTCSGQQKTHNNNKLYDNSSNVKNALRFELNRSPVKEDLSGLRSNATRSPVNSGLQQQHSSKAIIKLGSSLEAIMCPPGPGFKTTKHSSSPNKNGVHWEKSLTSKPQYQLHHHQAQSASSDPRITPPSSPPTKMASPPLSPIHQHSPHRQSPPHQHLHQSSSPKHNVPNSRPKPIQISQPSPSSSHRRRHSSSCSSSSSSSPSSPSSASSPEFSFAGSKWEASAPSPRAVPKPPTRWLGAGARDSTSPQRPDSGIRNFMALQPQPQQQPQQQRPQLLQRPVMTQGSVAAGAAFPMQMRSGFQVQPNGGLLYPLSGNADLQYRNDMSNHLKALLNVAG